VGILERVSPRDYGLEMLATKRNPRALHPRAWRKRVNRMRLEFERHGCTTPGVDRLEWRELTIAYDWLYEGSGPTHELNGDPLEPSPVEMMMRWEWLVNLVHELSPSWACSLVRLHGPKALEAAHRLGGRDALVTLAAELPQAKRARNKADRDNVLRYSSTRDT